MGKIILIIVGLIIATIGTICIFDARVITRNMFSFGDQNDGSLGLKMFGFIFAIIGGFIVFFNI